MKTMFKPSDELKALLKDGGQPLFSKAMAAQHELAKAIELPLRKGVLSGNIISDIFTPISLVENQTSEFPLDFLSPGTERDFVAYTIPNVGRIPERHVEADFVMVPTYDIGSSIDWALKFSRDARWDVAGRAMQVLEAGFTKKMNDDGWHTLLAAGVDRNIIVYDADASAGQFTKRLVMLLKTVMRRNGGGNSTSTDRGKLTDLYISVEAEADMASWGIDQIPDASRQNLINSETGAFDGLYGVRFHSLDELGVGQEYELYFEQELGGTPVSTGSDVEICVGLDLRSNDSFVMPVKGELEVFPDEGLHRQRRMGWYGWQQIGFASLDSRRIILGSL